MRNKTLLKRASFFLFSLILSLVDSLCVSSGLHVCVGLFESMSWVMPPPDSTSFEDFGTLFQETTFHLSNAAQGTVAVLEDAIVPAAADDLLAIGISESFAGFLGGLASRSAARLIGDTNVQSNPTETATGSYFGGRKIATRAATVAGLPRPLAILVGSISGSLLSESTIAISRKISQLQAGRGRRPSSPLTQRMRGAKKKRTQADSAMGNATSFPLARRREESEMQRGWGWGSGPRTGRRFLANEEAVTNTSPIQAVIRQLEYGDDAGSRRSPSTAFHGAAKVEVSPHTVTADANSSSPLLSWREIAEDVSKWVAYDLLLPSGGDEVLPLQVLFCGAMAGAIGKLVAEAFNATQPTSPSLSLSLSLSQGVQPTQLVDGGRFAGAEKSDSSTCSAGPVHTPLAVTLGRAGFEAGALFLAYETTLSFFQSHPLVATNPAIKAFLSKEFKQSWWDLFSAH